YVVIALVGAVAPPGVTAVVVGFATATEIAVRALGFGEASAARAATHAGIAIAIGALNTTIVRREVARLRSASRARLDAEIARLRDDARSYRLLAAPASTLKTTRANDDERLARSGVEEIHQSVLFALRLLRESLALHTAILLWQNDDGTHLRIS